MLRFRVRLNIIFQLCFHPFKFSTLTLVYLNNIDPSSFILCTDNEVLTSNKCFNFVFYDVIREDDAEDEVDTAPTVVTQDDLDPCHFAPTGDVYSYFQRRRMDPFR